MKTPITAACLLLLLAACSRQSTPDTPAPPTAPAPTTPQTDAPPAPAPVADNWELPGSLHPLTTERELEARFGKANLRHETMPGAEGIGSHPVLIVFPDDPQRRLELVMAEGDPDSPIQLLRVQGSESLWHSAGGIRLGMTLAQLVALNGAPLNFYGLSWDYGGSVQDWHGGKLANPVGSPVFHGVVLAARDDDTDGLPLGDSVFRSDDPRWPAKGERLVVRELTVSWPRDGEN